MCQSTKLKPQLLADVLCIKQRHVESLYIRRYITLRENNEVSKMIKSAFAALAAAPLFAGAD
jgi:hypothetical protein